MSSSSSHQRNLSSLECQFPGSQVGVMLGFIILTSLYLFASGATEVAVDDVVSVNLLKDVNKSAVFRASNWLLSERQEASGWGSFTPRAVVALALTAPYYPLSQEQWNLITKQLNIHLSLQLGNGVLVDKSSHLSRLALSVNALLATCQDPRHFQGLDLVKMLRSETDAALHKDAFSLPSVFVSLCLAGETTHADLTRLARMYQASRNKTDHQAIQLLGMSCMTNQTNLSSSRPVFVSYLREFASRFQNSLRLGTVDVYTKALAMQALFSVGHSVVDTSSLLADQETDGSFERSLLATYHAIPALLGTSLLAIGDKQCQRQQAAGHLESPSSQSSSKVVLLSAWVGEGLERDTHSLTVAIGDNDTLLDVLGAARKRNPIFRFSYDESPTGARVYSLAGIPNDAEREISWKLYTQKKGKHEHLKEIHAGIDKVYPSPEDSIVFWFKRN